MTPHREHDARDLALLNAQIKYGNLRRRCEDLRDRERILRKAKCLASADVLAERLRRAEADLAEARDALINLRKQTRGPYHDHTTDL